MRLKREHINIAKFEPEYGLDPMLDLALVGSECQVRIHGRASNWQKSLVVTSAGSGEQSALSPDEVKHLKAKVLYSYSRTPLSLWRPPFSSAYLSFQEMQINMQLLCLRLPLIAGSLSTLSSLLSLFAFGGKKLFLPCMSWLYEFRRQYPSPLFKAKLN